MTSISVGRKGPPAIPKNHSVTPISHKKFEGAFCCRVSVALEGNFYLVDPSGIVDCFPSFEAAFSAGSRALLSILNKRIVLPKKNAPKATEIVSRLKRPEEAHFVFGFPTDDY